MEEAIIRTQGLTKSFGTVQAVKGVDLAVEQGTVFGLLGPNGAGKTTTIRILTTLLEPDEGTAVVAGLDVVKDAVRLRPVIGLAGQFAAVDENLTGLENLEMVGRLYHLPRAEARRRAEEVLERFELADAAHRTAKNSSGGMRRRLDVGASLVGRPKVLFMDEPTTGLDPRSRVSLLETIEARVAAGTTVLLTTQYLDEADRLADRIAVIDLGTVIAAGTSDELKARVGGERLEVTLEDPSQTSVAVEALASMSSDPPEVEDGVVWLAILHRSGVIAEAVRRLDEAGMGIADLAVRRPTLDDVFLVLTGHAAEEREADAERAEEQEHMAEEVRT
jgi:ABC-2 type transport system ATP-binding protein